MGNIKFLGNVTPDAVQFVNASGTETGRIGKSGDDLTITNAVGDVLFGDGTSDVYIGNGLASVDILFEQNGSIRSATGSSIALTLGSSDTTLNVYNPQMANGMTLTSTMTMGSSGLINFTPTTGDVMQFSGQSIIKRLNANGGIRIGHDDQVIIAGGDTSTVLEANISGEVIALGAEQGVKIFSWVGNNTAWADREQWQFTDKMYFGQNTDTNLYRLSAGRLQTDGNFLANRVQSVGTQQNQFYSTYAGGGILEIKPSDTRTGKQPIIQYRSTENGSVNYFMANSTSTFFGTYDNGLPSDESGMIKITPDNTAEAPSIRIGDGGSGGANLEVGSSVKITNSGVSYFNGGDVGIGTGTPNAKLNVAGHTRITDNGRLTLDNIDTAGNGTVIRGGFLNPAAEANMVHNPGVINDLSGFEKWGTITVSGLYKTRSGSAGSYTYSNPVTATDAGWDNAFDGHSSTAGSWYSDNGVNGTTQGEGVITLEWTNELTYSAWAGIVFGSGSFSPTRLKIEAYRADAWQTLCDLSDATPTDLQVTLRQIGSNSGTNAATRRLRYTIGSNNTNPYYYFRIQTLYAVNYRAGDNNLSNLGTDITRGMQFLEKYQNNYVWGQFNPAVDNTYDLGNTSRRWKDLFLKGRLYDNNNSGGSAGQVLSSTGSGIDWVDANPGDITGVTASSPLTGGGTSGTVTVGIQTASASQAGALSAANWTTFNNKTSNTGTVTSVAATHGGNAFAVSIGNDASVNPSVDIAVGGTSAQYINGAGNLTTFPTIPQGDITGVTAGTGMTGGGTSGTVTLNVIGGAGITANADSITVDSTVLRTTGAQTISGIKTHTADINVGAESTDAAGIHLIYSASAPEIRIQAGESGASAFSIYNTATSPDAEQFFINNNLGTSHLGNARGALKLESSSGVVLTLSGSTSTFAGNIILSGTGRIQGIDTVSANTDAANKLYVDTAVAGVVVGDITAVTAGTGLTGGGTSGAVTLNIDSTVATLAATQTFTGTKTFNNNVVITGDSVDLFVFNTAETQAGIVFGDTQGGASQRAAIKFDSSTETLDFFVNDEVAERMSINTAGVLTILSGSLVLGGTGRIQGIDSVTATTDAANKAYVDAAVAGVPVGDITGVTAGSGLTGGGTSGAVTVNVDYAGTDNIILEAQDLSGTQMEDGFKILFSDTSNDVSFGNVNDLPFGSSNLVIGTTSTTAKAGNITTISTAQASAITANTAKVSDTGTPAVLSNGSAPSLNTNISAGEMRTLIGAGTSSLVIGTTASRAMAGDTTTISTTQASNITTNNGKVSDTGTPAILSNGTTPSLNSGISAAEVRTLIGAGTSSTTGTVTSVNASIGGSAIGVTGGAITTAGTLAFAFAGGGGEYIDGAGDLQTFPTIPQGDITGVTAGTNLNGGGTTGAVTLNLDAAIAITSAAIGSTVTLSESADRSNLLYVNSSTSSWGGLQIGNTANEFIFSLMGDGSTGGIYDDQNSDWIIQWIENSGLTLRHNGSTKLTTTSSGVTVTGSLTTTSDITVSGGDITLGGTGRIQGVDTVSANTDAANKLYVDTAVAGVPVGDITGVTAGTNLTGGGTSGTVTLNMATGGAGAGSYGSTSNGTKIDNITIDAYGRVTAVSTGATGSSNLAIGTTASTAKAGNTTTISTSQASAITANTAKTGITSSQASAITANTAKTGITSSQASAITANTAKTGITSGQASAITANTAKVGITSTQASNITTNNAKTGITSTQASNITTNNAKTGITSAQASAITANTAKVTDTGTPAILSNGSTPTLNSGISAAEVRTLIGAGTGSGTSNLVIGTTSTTAMAGNTTTITGTQAGNISTNNGKVSDTGTPAILSDGSVPTLNTNISAAEVRSLIGAGTGNSNLAIGTTASTAKAGNTTTITSTQAANIVTNNAKVSNVTQTTVSGNAGSATVLQNARTIAGVSFNGSANISLNNNAIANGAGYTSNTGDITNVSAGSGLTGGGASGSVTVNVDYSGTDNVVLQAQDNGDAQIDGSSKMMFSNTSNVVQSSAVSNLPFTNISNNNQLTNGAGYITSSSVPTIYTPDIWQVNDVSNCNSDRLLVFDTVNIVNGTTGTNGSAGTAGMVRIASAGTYEITYSVNIKARSGVSTRQAVMCYIEDDGTKVPGSSNTTYLRLAGSNQGGYTAMFNTSYVTVGANSDIALRIFWLDGGTKSLDIYKANGIQNTVSIRRIT